LLNAWARPPSHLRSINGSCFASALHNQPLSAYSSTSTCWQQLQVCFEKL
jgi:hypothetical protein